MFHVKRNVLGMVGCVVSVVIATNVSAVERTVSSIHITLDDWDLVPTLLGTQVESFVGLRNTTGVIGNNVSSIWFLRTSDTTWQVFAWHQQDTIKSIAHVKSTLGLADTTDANWPDATAQQGVDPLLAIPPDMFATGVFADDPFVAVIDTLPRSGAFLDVLTSTGWSAANIAIQTDESFCTQDEILTSLAAMVEADIATGAGGSIVEGFTLPLPKCKEWLSLDLPLGADGTWTVLDMTSWMEDADLNGSDLLWQSIPEGTVLFEPQTIVIETGTTDDAGQAVTSNFFVVTIKDQTPPSVDVSYLGNGAPPSIAPSGLNYFLVPVSITVEVSLSDNVDDDTTLESNTTIIIDSTELNGEVELTDPGFYTLRVTSADSAGNIEYYSEMIEVRDNPNYLAFTEIESIAVTAIDSLTDSVEVTLLLTSDQFDSCNINPSVLSIWLSENDTNIGRLQMSPDFSIEGVYDPTKVYFDLGVWHLTLQGVLQSDLVSNPNLTYLVTGNGNSEELGVFDYITRGKTFAAQVNAQNTLLSQVDPNYSCEVTPPLAAPALCYWAFELIPTPPPPAAEEMYSDWWACFFFHCANLKMGWLAQPHRISGAGRAKDDCNCDRDVDHTSAVASGGEFKIWLKGNDCCESCEILVNAKPIFTARAKIDHVDAAMVIGQLLIGIPGCGFVDAVGGAAVRTTYGGTWGFNTPLGGMTIPIVNIGTTDAHTPADISNCEPYPHCDIQINLLTRIRANVGADHTAQFGMGAASVSITDSKMRIEVTPTTTDLDCAPTNNGKPIKFDY